jgi:phosphoglycolate phosphatase-like HAD superfamily hydrolase
MNTALLWDMDGTVLRLLISYDQVQVWKGRLMARLAPLGWDKPLSPMLPNLEAALRDAPAELRCALYADLDRWEQDDLQGLELIAPVARRMCELSATYPTAIITNNGPATAEAGMELLRRAADARGWPPPKVGALLPRGPELAAKPAPDALEAALAQLGCQAGVMIGDARSDEEAALALQGQDRPVVHVKVSGDALHLPAGQDARALQVVGPALERLLAP